MMNMMMNMTMSMMMRIGGSQQTLSSSEGLDDLSLITIIIDENVHDEFVYEYDDEYDDDENRWLLTNT